MMARKAGMAGVESGNRGLAGGNGGLKGGNGGLKGGDDCAAVVPVRLGVGAP